MFSGCSVGPVIALPLCGWILTTWGWPAVFYITGSMAVAFYGLWQYFVYNTPQEHPRISPEEKKYLEDNLQESHTNEVVPFPWKEAMTSVQFWLGAAAHVGSDWGFHTFYTYGPKYIKDALQFDISQVNILNLWSVCVVLVDLRKHCQYFVLLYFLERHFVQLTVSLPIYIGNTSWNFG